MPPQPPIKILLLSGRSGSGKTSVANQIHAQLKALQISHVYLEADNLDQIFPKEEDSSELMLANLGSMWENFTRLRGCGCGRLLMNGTGIVMEGEGIRRTIERASEAVMRDAVGDVVVEMRGFILCASDESARARLLGRETEATFEEHFQSSLKMSKKLAGMDETWIEFVDTDGRGAEGVAGYIIERCHKWLLDG